MRNETYPTVGSRWKYNDPVQPREVEIVSNDIMAQRVRIENVATKKRTWVRLGAFNSTDQRGFSAVTNG